MGKNQSKAAENAHNIEKDFTSKTQTTKKSKKEYDPQKDLGVGTVMIKTKTPFYKRIVSGFSKR